MNKQEEIKNYVNADLAFLSHEEFSEKFDIVKPKDNSFLDQLEWVLIYLNTKNTASPIRYNEMRESVFHLNTFDGAWLLDAGRIGNANGGMGFFRPLSEFQATLDMFKEFNLKIFILGAEGEKLTTCLRKFRLMESKELRHLKGAPKIIENRLAIVSNDQKWYTYGDYHTHREIEVSGNSYSVPVPFSINPNYIMKPTDVSEYLKTDEYMEFVIQYNFALNVKLTGYYEWFAYIKEDEKSIGIKIPIAPESSKEVFMLRDLPPGDRRKKSICNFVKEHYRMVKNEFNDEIRQTLVKQHLRGETKFNWRGLQVNIIPAEYDLNRIGSKKRFLKL